MSTIFRFPAPAIGTKGLYSLLSPFSVPVGQLLECTAVRTIPSYLSDNDDPLQEVYIANGLTEDNYETDLKEGVEIVSLVNSGGFVLRVPARYIASFPVQDGVPYRSVAISAFLPPLPVDKDLSGLIAGIQELIQNTLGVSSDVKSVETSQIVAVTGAKNQEITTERDMVIGSMNTLYGQNAELLRRIEQLTERNAVLEKYIIDQA